MTVALPIRRDPRRVYAPAELGPDGYPAAWHRLPESGTYDLDGRLVEVPVRGGIKHLVRALADYRCVRCHHPYVSAGDGTGGEWSPCDEKCDHDGPMRHLTTEGYEDVVERGVARYMIYDLGAQIEAGWRILTVHHLDGDKANCRWWNLAALCQRCHLTIQGKVRMDRRWLHEHSPWFRPYVAGYYAWVYGGVELSRGDVDARMGELLALEERQLQIDGIPT